jgi:hypothetical protein
VTPADVFICYASEDRVGVARPLAKALDALGVSVWYDEFALSVGDSLRREIDHGLRVCRYGVVILSPRFFVKEWPKRELDGLTQRETESGGKVVLPVWHEVTATQVRAFSPILADRIGLSTVNGVDYVADRIAAAVRVPELDLADALTARAVAFVRSAKDDGLPHETECPRCRSTGYDRGRGHYVCGDCGLAFVGTEHFGVRAIASPTPD